MHPRAVLVGLGCLLPLSALPACGSGEDTVANGGHGGVGGQAATVGGSTSVGAAGATTGGATGTGGGEVVPGCTNGVRDGNETDVDCGGATCPGCALGAACLVSSDCLSDLCVAPSEGGALLCRDCGALADCSDPVGDGCCPSGCYADTDVDCTTVAPTGRFDLASDGLHVFGPVPIEDTQTVMQGLAFDDVHDRVYIVQVTEGDGSTAYSTHLANGDLTVSKLTTSGSLISSMHLEGFGHGVSIGVEPEGAGAYLWVEADSAPNDQAPPQGRGTAIARVLYDPGTTVDTADVTKFWPAADASPTAPEYSCNLDLDTGRLAVRYLADGGGRKLGLFNLEEVKAGGTRALVTPVSVPGGLGLFQGFTTFGSFAYMLTGDSGVDNTELYSFDWNTGVQAQNAGTAVFGSAVAREPEGMSVQAVGNAHRLTFGFGSHVSTSNSSRRANVAYKDGWIP